MPDTTGALEVPFEPRPLWAGLAIGLTAAATIIVSVEAWGWITNRSLTHARL